MPSLLLFLPPPFLLALALFAIFLGIYLLLFLRPRP